MPGCLRPAVPRPPLALWLDRTLQLVSGSWASMAGSGGLAPSVKLATAHWLLAKTNFQLQPRRAQLLLQISSSGLGDNSFLISGIGVFYPPRNFSISWPPSTDLSGLGKLAILDISFKPFPAILALMISLVSCHSAHSWLH
ncbi:hypothetical protein HPP92_028851 [Vanilla planifolia]|uniref:Uncharacterized protein n=1 Tax=Vanilla planifolia TaxID=51239 RepID=A0A835P654_VANPL|nr:hypothetical protein HPP92_028851 [Vanilla planifolia]KAG0446423.1 hypothetical protein HPP92_028840 [Vanilla planifolia]